MASDTKITKQKRQYKADKRKKARAKKVRRKLSKVPTLKSLKAKAA